MEDGFAVSDRDLVLLPILLFRFLRHRTLRRPQLLFFRLWSFAVYLWSKRDRYRREEGILQEITERARRATDA